MTRCSKCGAEHQRVRQRLCHRCHAANMRAWRAARGAELLKRQRAAAVKRIRKRLANMEKRRARHAEQSQLGEDR